jgi:hypothetical protein
VEPTFKDFERNRDSVRHTFLACVTIYHAIDRAAYPMETSGDIEFRSPYQAP